MYCQSSGDTDPLLLPSGKTQGGSFKSVLNFIKYRSALQALFDDLIELFLVLDSMNSRAIGDIVVNAHRKWVWLLKNHSYPLAEHRSVDLRSIDVFPIQ